MILLHKLGILGIRSFSPARIEALAFERPLTLIVGHNGAGKTTIVECLKMASTGELPPNCNKGHNLINDPKLGDTPEVKGQIRLAFDCADGKRVVAVRNFQLTHTRDGKGRFKATFKALESVMQTRLKNGETASVSQKCADMDSQIPSLMGVSKAILENVTFCHQEDSNWPLQEMTKLKKRFDDIFGATRYTKALEAVNALRKEQAKVAKDQTHQVELSKVQYTQTLELRKKHKESQDRASQIQEKIQVLHAQAQVAGGKAAAALEAYDAVRNFEAEFKHKQKLAEEARTAANDIRSGLAEAYTDPLEALEDCEKELRMANKELELSLKEVDGKIQGADEGYTTKQKERDLVAAQSAEVTGAEMRIKEENEKKKKLMARHGSKYASMDSLSQLQSEKARLDKDGAKHERSLNEENDRLQQDLNKLSNQSLQVQAELNGQRAEKQRLEASLQECTKLISEIPKYESELSSLGSLKSQHTDDDDALLTQKETTLRTLVSERDAADEEVAKQRGVVERLEAVSEKVHAFEIEKTKLKDLENRVNELNEGLEKAGFERTTSSDELLLQVHDTESSLAQLRKEYGEAVGSRGLVEGTLKELEVSEGKRKRLREETIGSLPEGVDLYNFESSLMDTRTSVTEKTKEVLLAKNADQLYTSYLDHSVKRRKCAFCTRGFKDDSEIDAMKRSLGSRIDALPTQLSKSSGELEKLENRLSILDALKNDVDNITNSENQENTETLNKKHTEVSSKVAALEGSCRSTEDRLSKLMSVSRIIEEIEKIEKLRTTQKQRVTSLSVHVSEESLGDARTSLKALERNLGIRQDAAKKLENEVVDIKTAKYEATKAISMNQQRRVEVEAKLERSRGALIESENLKSKIGAVESALKSTEKKLEGNAEALEGAKKKVQKCQEEKFTAFQELKTSLSELDGLINELKQSTDTITKMQKLLSSSAEIAANMARVQKACDDARLEAEDLRQERGRVSTEIDENKTILESVEENLKLKKKEQEVSVLEEELRTLQARAAGANPTELKKVYEKAQEEKNETLQEMARQEGEHKACTEWTNQCHRDLQSTKHKNIDAEYANAVQASEVTNMAVKDLGKYYNALDRALMKYHSLKMEEINVVLKEMWIATYKGEDIDFVALRSDGEDDVTSSVGKSYNYRVVMVKNGVELDMRGRCSAGQKVLASIIIRLALAESFCVNCGILALDEPTTNLDRKNIEGLARSLATLIEMRKNHSNFQLILITHDEEFVRMLGRYQPCDKFYQVVKDSEGYSTIRQADIRKF